jgi:very-short-patch-repair endonuclease
VRQGIDGRIGVMLPYRKNLLHNAKSLRTEMTEEEKHLWFDFLCALPVRVKRQKVIGCYIVDFYISKAKTVIEIDGLQHTAPDAKKADEERDQYLRSLGITVLRYSNESVKKNFRGVITDILEKTKIDLSK